MNFIWGYISLFQDYFGVILGYCRTRSD